MEKPKALVLLSGGIDSTTCLAMAMERYGERNVSALNMFYGQKHQREISAARQVASHYGILYMEMDLSCVMQYSDCPLLAHSDREIRHESYANQLKAIGGEGTVDTYVPFRNGLFLSAAASVALSIGASVIYYGAHADDEAADEHEEQLRQQDEDYFCLTLTFDEADKKAVQSYIKEHGEEPVVRIILQKAKGEI